VIPVFFLHKCGSGIPGPHKPTFPLATPLSSRGQSLFSSYVFFFVDLDSLVCSLDLGQLCFLVILFPPHTLSNHFAITGFPVPPPPPPYGQSDFFSPAPFPRPLWSCFLLIYSLWTRDFPFRAFLAAQEAKLRFCPPLPSSCPLSLFKTPSPALLTDFFGPSCAPVHVVSHHL